MTKQISTQQVPLTFDDIKKNYKRYIKNNWQIENSTEFKIFVTRLELYENLRVKLINQHQAIQINDLIIDHPFYPEIRRLKRIENLENKKEDTNTKKEIQRLIKMALVETLNRHPDVKEEITLENINDFILEERNKRCEDDGALQMLIVAEQDYLKKLEAFMMTFDIYKRWLKIINGAGVKLSAKLLAGIEDIRRFPAPSNLWSYCGYGDPDPEHNKRENGQITYSPKMKKLIWLLGESFIKQSSPYKVIFDKRRIKTAITHPEWTKMHSYNDAKRVMMKRFLAELYDNWYKSLGMTPPALPFGVEIEGHHLEPNIVDLKSE